MRRIISTLAEVHSADDGKPPARHNKIAQSIGYEWAVPGITASVQSDAMDAYTEFLMVIPHVTGYNLDTLPLPVHQASMALCMANV